MKAAPLFFMIFLIVGWIGPQAHAEEASLQSQIDAAQDHATITMDARTYNGNITITRPISLIGTEGTVIRGDGTGNVITIQASGVRLEHLRIEHGSLSRNSEQEYAGVKVMSSNNILKNLEIADVFHGVYIHHAHDNEVSQVSVSGSGGEIGGQGNGIQLIYSQRNHLNANKVKGTRDGIYFYYSDDNTAEKNEITGTRYGLHYMYSHDNRIRKNRFSRNTGGAAVMLSKRVKLEDNEFSFHQGSRAFGLLLQESEEAEVTKNRFFHNLRGLYIENSQRNRLSENEFAHNQVGVEIWSSAGENKFSANRFQNHVAPVLAVGDQGGNQWSEAGIGNRWGNGIPLLDINQDGVGDRPVRLQSSLYQLVQENELVYLFLKSPSIPVYEKISQLLNKQAAMVEDPYPTVNKKPASHPALWVSLALLGLALWIWRRRRYGG